MYHHFHDDELHPQGQGSICGDVFSQLIEKTLEKGYKILDPKEYLQKVIAGSLDPMDTSITFDDSLRCQYDVAAKTLDTFGLRAFFFVYTDPFSENETHLEYFRDFRNVYYKDIENFYTDFFEIAAQFDQQHRDKSELAVEKGYLSNCPFYLHNDKVYRYMRDYCLGLQGYSEVMIELMKKRSYSIRERKKILFMNEAMVSDLSHKGHAIGLHSHSHPTVMTHLSVDQQANEYQRNSQILHEITNIKPDTMSHPCGLYNDDTLKILRDLGVKIGFQSTIDCKTIKTPLEIPREDHSNLVANWL